MAGRSHPTFKKRQKEQARKEKQRNKAERKAQRKLEKLAGISSPEQELAVDLAGSEPGDAPLPDSENTSLPDPTE